MGSRDLQWWIGNIADSFTRWAVPAFVMITGALLLRSPLEESPTAFYRRRLGRILLPLIFWSVLYMLWNTVRRGSVDWQTTLIKLLTGSPYYHMWYIFMLVGLYLVAPFVNYAVTHIPRAWLRTAIIVSFALAIIETYSSLIVPRSGGTFLYLFLPFLGYFLAGHYFATAEQPPIKPRTALLLFGLCGLMVAVVTGIVGVEHIGYTYGYANPIVILLSFSMFWLIQSTRENHSGRTFINLLTPLALGIYLIHPIWLEILLQVFPNYVILMPLIGIPAIALLGFIFSAATCKLMSLSRALKRLAL